MSVAAAAYVTQIPIVSLDFQQFVCLSAWNNSTYTRSISVGFYTGGGGVIKILQHVLFLVKITQK
jgi:hypothetical protein